MRSILVLCAILAFFASSAAAGSASVSLSGDAVIYGVEGAFSDDVRAYISSSGYTADSGQLIVCGLISKMSSNIEYILDDSASGITLRFPKELINDLPGGVHDITASSWDFQGRSKVVIPTAIVGRLFIKTAAPAARIDYRSEKLTGLRHNDGVPFRPETRRQARYAFERANGTAIGEPDLRGTFPIPEEWMNGERVSVIHLNELDSLNSEPQIIDIPKRPPAPWVFALGETSAGALDGRIVGLMTEEMEYSANGGIDWVDCPGWMIENLAPSENYRVRFKAVEDASFAGGQRTLVINAAEEK
jgi:hypothetical protein